MDQSPLDVVYEDNHLIVVNKPPLQPTMGVARDELSLVMQVKEYLRQRYDKPGNVYLGVVSRLDSFSRGVIVFARTSKAASRLSQQFREGTVRKQYLAIVESEIPVSSGKMTDWLVKDDARRRMVTVPPSAEKARRADLQWRRLGIDTGQTLVEIDLLTGRKHQIRIQFSSRGWPLLGDRKYGGQQRFNGIALLSKSLSLVHPVRQEPMTFQIDPPAAWKIQRFVKI